MSRAPSGDAAATAGGRPAAAWVGAGLAALLVVVFAWWVGTPQAGEPLDPRSHEPLGTSAVVALLEELGAEVTITTDLPTPGDGHDVTLLLQDRLDDAATADLGSWVQQGGVLVVADPTSDFVPRSDGAVPGGEGGTANHGGPLSRLDRGRCDIGPLEDGGIEVIEVAGRPATVPVYGDARSCFGSPEQAFVVAAPSGSGTRVTLANGSILTNRALGGADNAAVAAALLAPREGTRVAVLDPGAAAAHRGSGDESLWGVAPIGARRALVQLLVAFVVYAAWRGRRLGRPVAEPQPVQVASSELVAAVGSLLERSGSPQHAAELLRSDLRSDLTERLGLPAGLPVERFFGIVEARSGLDPDRLRLALGPGPVSSGGELLQVAEAIDVVRKEVLDSAGTPI